MRAYATCIAVALAAVVMAPRGASAQSPDSASDLPTVAVMDFTGFMLGHAGNSVNLGKAVSAMLTTEFASRPGMRVIERAKLNALLTEQKLALSGRVEAGSAIQVGKMLGAQYVFFGQVTSIDGTLRLDIRAVNVETSKVVAVLKKTDKTVNLLNVVDWVADRFSEELHLTPPSERPAVAPIPVEATIEFSRAVDYEDRGDTARAVEHYKKALQIDPGFRGAKLGLERLEGGGKGSQGGKGGGGS